eukprot:scaffold96_cov167-Ochromonas_danica.AAC.24
MSSSLQQLLKQADPSDDLIQGILISNPREIQQPREDGSLPLHLASFNATILSNLPLLRLLTESYPTATSTRNKVGQLPIHKAVCVASKQEHLPAIAYLIDCFPEGLLATTKDGQTPLHLAIAYPKECYGDLINLLVQRGVEAVRQADRYGQLPFHLAAGKRRMTTSILELLYDNFRSALSCKDNKGENPDVEVVFLLCDLYPRALFEQDNNGCTPIMRLLQNKHRDDDIEQAVLDIADMERSRMKEEQELKQLEDERLLISSRPSLSRASIQHQWKVKK